MDTEREYNPWHDRMMRITNQPVKEITTMRHSTETITVSELDQALRDLKGATNANDVYAQVVRNREQKFMPKDIVRSNTGNVFVLTENREWKYFVEYGATGSRLTITGGDLRFDVPERPLTLVGRAI